jgi:hypothetical protein
MLWFYVVKNYNANLAELAIAPWPFPSTAIFTACKSSAVKQVYYR